MTSLDESTCVDCTRRHTFAPTDPVEVDAAATDTFDGPALHDTVSEVPPAWQRWVVVQLTKGLALDAVVSQMVTNGFSEASAYTTCIDLANHPAVQVARESTKRLAKLESVLSVRQKLRDLTAIGSEVEVRDGVSGTEFLEEYYSANLPVVLTDLTQDWPAVERWTPDYLASVIGAEPVEVMIGREEDAEFEINSARHLSTMPFDEYVRYVSGSEWSNDRYLVANNHFLERPAAAPLWSDFCVDQRYFNPARASGTVFLWFGPGGTITPLHHDVVNVMLVQVYGRKLVRLISPLETHCVYNDVGVFSKVDMTAPDQDAFPRFTQVRPFHVLLEPGQALFIPVGWWHHVTALDTSMSLSFTNFHWVNEFTWNHPEVVP